VNETPPGRPAFQIARIETVVSIVADDEHLAIWHVEPRVISYKPLTLFEYDVRVAAEELDE
jgi:hypothetical protein